MSAASPDHVRALPVLFFVMLLAVASVSRGQRVEAQIDQARQFRMPAASGDLRATVGGTDFPAASELLEQDDSFGAQQFLKRQEKPRLFNVFGEVAGYHTNNVALTRRATEPDRFLVASFGINYRQPLTRELAVDATIRGALFRYDEFNVLDFNSIDAGAGLTWAPEHLAGVALFGRYNFTDLIGDETGDEFFQNHTIALGAQKTFILSRAHAFFLGASAQFGFADPSVSQRDEYSAYVGYHLQATRHLEADLFYRYGYFVYREEGERRDHNQTLSLSLRYNLTRWMSISASSFLGWNRSNAEVFDYHVWNVGGLFGVSLRF